MISFFIVTACKNAGGWIGETIASIVTQTGDFELTYHVQDGGSSDDTLEIVHAWQRFIQGGQPMGLRRRIQMSVASGPDEGMYDALDKAFNYLAPDRSCWLSWLNGDDRLQPGCLQTIVEIIKDLPGTRWLGGRGLLLNSAGALRPPLLGFPQPQRTIQAGLHEGRHLAFIMQEGTFFRAELWADGGGIDTGFKLAGDWDLWRRFAAIEPYCSVNASFASHRRRPGQLSSTMDAYYAEIDGALGPDGINERDDVWQEYRLRLGAPATLLKDRYWGPVIDFSEPAWRRCEDAYLPLCRRLFSGFAADVPVPTIRLSGGVAPNGFMIPNGAARPDQNLPLYYYQIISEIFFLEIQAASDQVVEVRIVFRSICHSLTLMVLSDAPAAIAMPVQELAGHHEIECAFMLEITAGLSRHSLTFKKDDGAPLTFEDIAITDVSLKPVTVPDATAAS